MVQGSKNAALPLIAAALLCGEQTMLTNCPQIHDVEVMLSLVEELGGSVLVEGHQVMIDSHTFDKTVICQDAVKELRASVLLMGACLAKFGEVTISYPGGCSIGKRPIDFHIHAFQKMGAEIVEEEDKMICRCITPLHGVYCFSKYIRICFAKFVLNELNTISHIFPRLSTNIFKFFFKYVIFSLTNNTSFNVSYKRS